MYPFCIFASLIGSTGYAVAFDTLWIQYFQYWFPLRSRDLCTCIFSTLCTVLLSKISTCWPWMTLTLIMKMNRTFVRHLSQYVYRFVGRRQRGGLSRTTDGSHRLIGNTDSTSVLPSAIIAKTTNYKHSRKMKNLKKFRNWIFAPIWPLGSWIFEFLTYDYHWNNNFKNLFSRPRTRSTLMDPWTDRNVKNIPSVMTDNLSDMVSNSF